MSLSALPTECIELILQELQDRGHIRTLGSLLLANRYFCSMTLPYFYTAAIEGRNIIDSFALFQLLLRQRPPKDVSPILSAAFDVFPDQPAGSTRDRPYTPTSTGLRIDYLSYVRSFYFEHLILDQWHERGYTSRLFAMVFTSKTGETAHAYGEGGLDASLPFPPSIIMKRLDMKIVRQCAMATALRRDLTWTLCIPFLEQVRSMIIPLSDIGRYIPLLERFNSLVCLDFQMDEFLEFSGDMAEVDPDVAIELELCRDRRNQQFKDMLLFVRKHLELFPGQLEDVDCPNDTSWGVEDIRCPLEIWEELNWLVLSKKELKEINTFNWSLVGPRIFEVNLGSVKVIDLQGLSGDELGHLTDISSSRPPLLSRCRSLRELRLEALSEPFSFKWAVDEKLAYNRRSAPDHTSDSVDMSSTIALPKEPQLALIPLEVISIQIPFSSRNWLDDIVFAFGDTLKKITAQIYVADGSTEEMPSIRVGQDWRLPQIRTVYIWSHDVQVLIDPDLLQGMGENLESIELEDKSHRHQYRDLCLMSPPSSPLPKLHTINFHGGPAAHFHPDTLLMTPGLESLALGTEPGSFDASLGESLRVLEDAHQDQVTPSSHFSRWTWNWNLLSLKCLYLNGEFAYYFPFRMLEACPSVQRLQLDLQGRLRVLELQDFISTVSETFPTNGDSLSRSTKVILSSVEHLTLRGDWEMSDDVLPTLFSTVFSKMLFLMEYQTRGYSVQGWIAALKGHGRLREARCGLPRPGDDEMIVKGMGLVSKPRPTRHFLNGKEVINDEDDRPLFLFYGKLAWYYDKESS